ncbi:hypothetical protein PsorP6_019522 [Peronosclerospora sorghi]|nr:hypothetical protein PsorP6_019534 [Peronosclerospora sorghi]KAI9895166.1 hypothetical protein PsorP6_019522 [Peronosclerospora sorghi]
MCALQVAVDLTMAERCYTNFQSSLAPLSTKAQVTNNLAEKRVMRAMKKRLTDRMYQCKRRAKRKNYIRLLERDVHVLESEIARLYRFLHDTKVAASNAEYKRRQQLQHHAQFIVMQYFNVYHTGYASPLSGLQESLLRSIMAADVVGVDLCGVDAFVQQWRLYGQHFSLCILEPQILKTETFEDQSVIVKVEVMLYLRFNHQTIHGLFPSLKTGQVDPELILPLVTGTTSVVGTYTFVVGHRGYMSRIIVSLELLETLRRVLGSLQNVTHLTKGGNIALSTGTINVE